MKLITRMDMQQAGSPSLYDAQRGAQVVNGGVIAPPVDVEQELLRSEGRREGHRPRPDTGCD